MYPEKLWREVVTIISGKNQKDVENANGKYPIYGSGGKIGYADEYLCPANTVVLGRKGTIDKPIFVEEKFWNIDTAFGIVAKEGLLPKYLYYFCQLYNFKQLDKSTGRPSLSKTDLMKIVMPVPDISEQQKIVSKIEVIFSDLENAINTLNRINTELSVYAQMVLKAAFANIEEKKAIKEISSLVTSGSRGWAKYYSDKGARFIRITDLTRDSIYLKNDSIQYVKLPDEAEGKRSRLHKDDVLVSITADLGSITLIPRSIGEAYVNQHIAMIRFNRPDMGKYYAWYLRSEYGQRDLLKNKRGGGKLGLGLDDIRNTPVPVVDSDNACLTVQSIEQKMSNCEYMKKIISESFLESAKLQKSILKKAFEGRLV